MNFNLLLLFLALTFITIYLCDCFSNLKIKNKIINEGFKNETTKPTPPMNLLNKFKELSKESFQEAEDINPCPNIKLTKKEDDENEQYQYCLEFPEKHIKRCYSKEKTEHDITPYQLAYTAFGDFWITLPKNQRKKCIEEKKNDLASWWLCNPIELKKIERNTPTNKYSKEIYKSLKEVCRLD